MNMLAVSFDTLKFANRLKLVGVDSKQAEAEAEIFSEIFEVNLRALATKDDLEQLKKEMDVKFEMLRKEMDNQFKIQRKDIDNQLKEIDGRLGVMNKEIDGRLGVMNKEIDGRFGVMNAELSSIKWLLRVVIAGTFGLLAKTFLG